MSHETLKRLLCQRYFHWRATDSYMRKGQLPLALKYIFIENEAGEQQIRLDYYKNPDCEYNDLLFSECLDASLGDMELFSIIDAHMMTDKWFEVTECFTEEWRRNLPLFVGSIEVRSHAGKFIKLFHVKSAGYVAPYQDAAGRCVSTQTVFDICVPTKWLEVGVWYAFSFVSNQANKASWHGFPNRYTNPMSLVLTGVLESWAFGIGAYNGRSDPQLCDSYEVRYAPDGNGFLFRMKQEGIERIWFKAAWLKSEGQDECLCQQALRHWLE